MGFGFVTTGGSPDDRLAYWTDLICRHHIRMSCYPTRLSEFNGQIFVNELGPAQITSASSGATVYRRNAEDLIEHESGYILVHLAQGGTTTFETARGDFTVNRGQMICIGTQDTFRMTFSAPAQFVTLRAPRMILDGIADPDMLDWKIIDGREGIGAMLRALLSETAAQSSLSANDQARVLRIVIDLLGACLRDRIADATCSDRDRLSRAKRFMLANLADTEMNPETVAEAVGLSVRSLYRLFAQEDTTFMRWLMARRVEASYEALAGGQCRDVTDAAFSHGFKDLSHFSRTFRKRYQETPRDVLRSHFSDADVYTKAFVKNFRSVE